MRRAAVIALLLSACTTAGMAEFQFPADMFEELCETFRREEDLHHDQEVIVLSETRPIFEMFALHVAYVDDDLTPEVAPRDDRLSEQHRALHTPAQIRLPSSLSCKWNIGGKEFKDYYGGDHLLLELSSVVRNPFVEPGEFGIFARLSYGGREGAGWYWIALSRLGEGWKVSQIMPLPISDG